MELKSNSPADVAPGLLHFLATLHHAIPRDQRALRRAHKRESSVGQV